MRRWIPRVGRRFVMLHRLLFTAALGAALLVPATASAQSRAQDASPPAQKRAAPAVRASAQKLQNDARRLDAKAAGLERASVAKRDRALEGRASAEALEARARRARGTARARPEPRASPCRLTSPAASPSTAPRTATRPTRAFGSLRGPTTSRARRSPASLCGTGSSPAQARSADCTSTPPHGEPRPSWTRSTERPIGRAAQSAKQYSRPAPPVDASWPGEQP